MSASLRRASCARPSSIGALRCAVAVLALAACTHGAEPVPAPAPDPCALLREEIAAVHARVRCREESECELAPGVLAPEIDWRAAARTPPRYGAPQPRPCGSAIHRESRVELDALFARWARADCGPVSAPGSTACVSTSHGAHPFCRDGQCALAM